MSEKILQGEMGEYLSNWFDVSMEVKSDCKDSRIDLVMKHKSIKNELWNIGVEIKVDDIKRGAELGAWLKQAQRYATRKFDGNQVYVSVYPHIACNYLHEGDKMNPHSGAKYGHPSYFHEHHNTSGLLWSAFQIGELQRLKNVFRGKEQEFLRIVFNAQAIWDSRWPNTFRNDKLPSKPCIQ